MTDFAIPLDLVYGRSYRVYKMGRIAEQSQFCLSSSGFLELCGRFGVGGDFAFVQNCARIAERCPVRKAAKAATRTEGNTGRPTGRIQSRSTMGSPVSDRRVADLAALPARRCRKVSMSANEIAPGFELKGRARVRATGRRHTSAFLFSGSHARGGFLGGLAPMCLR